MVKRVASSDRLVSCCRAAHRFNYILPTIEVWVSNVAPDSPECMRAALASPELKKLFQDAQKFQPPGTISLFSRIEPGFAVPSSESEVDMNLRHEVSGLCSLVVGAALLSLGGSAIAQTSSLPAGQVSGAQLQAWLDGKATWAGLNHASKCTYLNSEHATKGRRLLFMTCPNGYAGRFEGKVQVKGDELCSSFAQPVGDDCVTWHQVGDATFEQRSGGSTLNTVYMLLSSK